jgi:hypothetical protein
LLDALPVEYVDDPDTDRNPATYRFGDIRAGMGVAAFASGRAFMFGRIVTVVAGRVTCVGPALVTKRHRRSGANGARQGWRSTL